MDKTIIFAVAGSGKTTYIIDSLSLDKRTLIVTYTVNNYNNLLVKIMEKFNGCWPDNIFVMRYFQFLYSFCYKPFLADRVKAKGITFETNPQQRLSQKQAAYYMTSSRYLYSNRIALLVEKKGVLNDINERIETYFDEFIIDEVQDIAGRDFTLLENLMETNVNMLFVGDFFQHTFDTSRDGNVNKGLFNDFSTYSARFSAKGFIRDTSTLNNSWRCSKNICEYISDNLGIDIHSNRCDDDNTTIELVSDSQIVKDILADESIVKLHFQKGASYGLAHKNWGDVKGEDCYKDVCIMLNKTAFKSYSFGTLSKLPPRTRNKLYVAITRAHGDCYFIEGQ